MWKLATAVLAAGVPSTAFLLPSPTTLIHPVHQGGTRPSHLLPPHRSNSNLENHQGSGTGSGSSYYSSPTKRVRRRRSQNGRNGYVCLKGPRNVMSLEERQLINHIVEGIVGGIGGGGDVNVTEVLDWASLNHSGDDVFEPGGLARGGISNENGDSSMQHFDFLPRELQIIEQDVKVIESFAETSPMQSPDAKSKASDYPSIQKIIKFSLPAIGVWLCSPVLSMIDTASVGLLAGTAQQAALNPAVSITDYGALLVAFMYTATTNLVAAAQEKDADPETSGEGNPRTTRTLITALRLALMVGVFFGAVLGTSASTLLKLLIGNDSLDPAVFSAALRYVQIRCLGMPAAVVIGTAQSACLGMQDVKSPLYVLAAAAGINFLGDVLLVRNGNPWLGGAAGAAWATVLSQYGALLIFMKWLTAKKDKIVKDCISPEDSIETATPGDGKDSKNLIRVTRGGVRRPAVKAIRKNLFSSSKRGKDKTENQPKKNEALARGFLAGKYKESDVLNIADLDRSTARKFLPFVIPVTTTSIGRVSGYLAMSHVASSALGTLDMAAHQIAISIFCCLAPVVDALNQVAQSFVPGIFARKKSKERALALRRTSINFAKVGASFGAVIVGLVTFGVPFLSRFFTTDPMVLERVKNAIPGIAVFLGFDGLMCIGEGTLLGQKDLAFLRNMYASFFFIVPAFMFRLKRRALSGIPVGIGTMWGTFSVYEVVRTILWLLRVVQLQWKTEKEAELADDGASS
eukprot:CAMPEP_0171331234 /NCGR_PEP_ID=MMETSP0878-20121228/2561_1 /TAXON_ID=67004 /ORGANISM="Thalassiosira weissflogii, Strain CCMP1336" /LENGTH=744 /DNA_ID=CAMNT_0011831733 /DNA_START=583 /DNA_END=2817 /DNA_ORIENTATION=+